MDFNKLCKDFNDRKPHGEPIAHTPFFNVKWENGNDSINELLRRGLKKLGFEYINDFDGIVWFLYYGVWESCTHEIKDGKVHFYMCKYAD